MSNSSIDMNQSAKTSPGQSGSGRNCKCSGTLHSPKREHNWNLTMRLFSVIILNTRWWVCSGVILHFCGETIDVFYNPSLLGWEHTVSIKDFSDIYSDFLVWIVCFLVEWHINLHGLFNAKAIRREAKVAILFYHEG